MNKTIEKQIESKIVDPCGTIKVSCDLETVAYFIATIFDETSIGSLRECFRPNNIMGLSNEMLDLIGICKRIQIERLSNGQP